MADRDTEQRGIDVSNDDESDERIIPYSDRKQTNDDYLRGIRKNDSGFGDVVRIYVWLAGQYSLTFLLVAVALMVSITGFATIGLLFLVPAVMSSEGFGMMVAVWSVLNMVAARIWMKNCIARIGVNI